MKQLRHLEDLFRIPLLKTNAVVCYETTDTSMLFPVEIESCFSRAVSMIRLDLLFGGMQRIIP
jgi:hypothetical protein